METSLNNISSWFSHATYGMKRATSVTESNSDQHKSHHGLGVVSKPATDGLLDKDLMFISPNSWSKFINSPCHIRDKSTYVVRSLLSLIYPATFPDLGWVGVSHSSFSRTALARCLFNMPRYTFEIFLPASLFGINVSDPYPSYLITQGLPLQQHTCKKM